MPHPDQKYIDALLHNEAGLLQELYQKFSGRIRHLVLSNGGTEADAGDIFQEALLAIYRKAREGSFTLTCPFEAFLYLVCRNKWLNELKRRKGKGVTIETLNGYSKDNDAARLAEEVLLQQQRTGLLHRKLAQLGKGCRELLLLSWNHHSMQEVSQLLHMSYGYARKKKSECMDRLIRMVKADPEFENLKW